MASGFVDHIDLDDVPLDPTLKFVSIWKTNNSGVSNSDQIKLPLELTGSYSFMVDWGDNSMDVIAVWNQPEVTHTYAAAGTFIVTISGAITGFSFSNSGDKDKILGISSWGPLRLGNSSNGFFHGCSNLVITAQDTLDTVGMMDFRDMFRDAFSVTTVPNIGSWDTSQVTCMIGAFINASLFSGAIGNWDTSSVVTMNGMFINTSFDQDLSNWDVSSVTGMAQMFINASFDQDLSNWDVSSVTNMGNMFVGSGFSTTNYDLLLVAWDLLTLQNGVSFHAGSAQFNAGAPATARANIISNFSWSITDGGPV